MANVKAYTEGIHVDTLNDFGFTAVHEDELESVADLADAQETVGEYEARLDRLYNAMQPLLSNLKLNPEKEYILWPNRLEKVEEFEGLLQDIYTGKKK